MVTRAPLDGLGRRMAMSDEKQLPTLDLRHIGRMNDKEMPIRQAGMELSKPGMPDLRRRKHSITLPEDDPDAAAGAENPPQTER